MVPEKLRDLRKYHTDKHKRKNTFVFLVLFFFFTLPSGTHQPPFSSISSHLVALRSGREELQDWGGGPNAAHHHGYEGQDEDPREEQAGDL